MVRFVCSSGKLRTAVIWNCCLSLIKHLLTLTFFNEILLFTSIGCFFFFSQNSYNSILPLHILLLAAGRCVSECPALLEPSVTQDHCPAIAEAARGWNAGGRDEPFVPSASRGSSRLPAGVSLGSSRHGGESEGSALVIEFVNNRAGTKGSVLRAGWKNHPEHVLLARVPLQERQTEQRPLLFRSASPGFTRSRIRFHWINLRAISWKLDRLWNEM